jgi:hypothetical protein
MIQLGVEFFIEFLLKINPERYDAENVIEMFIFFGR